MTDNPEPKTAPVRYTVRVANTGGHACGPYGEITDARRECKRLNREAQTGVKANQEPINFREVLRCPVCKSLAEKAPQQASLPREIEALASALENPVIPGHAWCPTCRKQAGVEWEVQRIVPERITHDGVPQSYEIVTDEGVVVA